MVEVVCAAAGVEMVSAAAIAMIEMPDVSWRLLEVVLTRVPSSNSGDVTGYTYSRPFGSLAWTETLSGDPSQSRRPVGGASFQAAVACGSRNGEAGLLGRGLTALIAQSEIQFRRDRRNLLLTLRRLGARRETVHEFAVIGHLRRDILDHLGDVAEEAGELLIGDELRHRVGVHLEPLSKQDLHPAFLGEQLLRIMLEETA